MICLTFHSIECSAIMNDRERLICRSRGIQAFNPSSQKDEAENKP
jgi:hypothetical protein